MKELEPIEVFNVTYDDAEIAVYREELLRSPKLADSLTSYERLLGEMAIAEYELRKLHHSRVSMMAEMKRQVLEYVADKHKPKEDAADTEE